jgi:hypothetical protein
MFYPKDSFRIQQSFTVLDWFLFERVMTNRDFRSCDLDRDRLIQLCMNLFPGGNTVFHMLAGPKKQHLSAGFDPIETTHDLFEAAF